MFVFSPEVLLEAPGRRLLAASARPALLMTPLSQHWVTPATPTPCSPNVFNGQRGSSFGVNYATSSWMGIRKQKRRRAVEIPVERESTSFHARMNMPPCFKVRLSTWKMRALPPNFSLFLRSINYKLTKCYSSTFVDTKCGTVYYSNSFVDVIK